jgi:YYY domain-containing protein
MPERVQWGSLLLDLFLIALIAIGVTFRFSWTNWNQDTDLHPDEYGLTGTLSQLAIPKSIGDYFNTRISPLSPYQKYDVEGNPLQASAEYRVPDNRMRWGQWPLTLIRWTAELTGNTGYGELRLMGRRLSALADSLALLVIFLMGWQLYSRRTGLLAAALSALAVMQIQQSHFMTVDTFAALFTALTMYCAVRAASPAPPDSQTRYESVSGWGWYALFGLFFGMALASRINLLPLFGEILVAAGIAYARQKERQSALPDLTRFVLGVILAGVIGLLTFRLTQPMSFRAQEGDTTLLTLNPNPEWVESMKVAQAESSGVGGGPPGEQWTDRPVLLFPFINMVVWGMGLPFGLTAWAGFGWAVWRSLKGRDDEWQRHLLPVTWVGGYFLFMGTRWVKSIRYFLPIYPFMALFAAWALVQLWLFVSRQRSESQRPSFVLRHSSLFKALTGSLFAFVLLGALAWAWGFTSIYRHENSRVQATRWMFQNIPAPFNLHLDTANGPYTEPLPSGNTGPLITAEAPSVVAFRAHVDGTVAGFTVGHARNSFGDVIPGSLRVVLAADPAGAQPLAQADLPIAPVGTDPRGDSATTALGPAQLQKGVVYYLFVTAPSGGPLEVTGATISNENWDEYLPLRFDERDPFGGLYNGVTMEVHWLDTEDKRQMFLENLRQVDYVFVQSQRRLWSAPRLPSRYPMTLEYYRALFDGRLGFELAAEFQSPFVIGPLQVSDAPGAWAWGQAPDLTPNPDDPFNDNLFASEEAFSVYDHAPVWVFRKRADFDLEQAQAVLDAIDLSTVVDLGPREATRAPTLLRMPATLLAQQRMGGTWRQMFDEDSLLNRVEVLGVTAWWLTVLVLGLIALPLTYAVFKGLPDRGYALGKTVALLFIAWFAWLMGSLELLPFTQGTIALGVAALALLSSAFYWPRRAEINTYLREHRRHILIVEGVFLAWFVFDLLIRLGNPDLWHPYYGGEKPMVFSYFNAVLKSTYFPPYNPWLSGAFLNYYYYGFVLVGVLVKLLGIVPTFAYNLILPTLFALTGVNAFCVAYNLVKSLGSRPETPRPLSEAASLESVVESLKAEITTPTWQWTVEEVEGQEQKPEPVNPQPRAPTRPHTRTLPSPYLAGVAAALLIVVLGNLGQLYTFTLGFQRAASPEALGGAQPGEAGLGATLNGLSRVLVGESTIPLGLGDWYWKATRIITEINHEGAEITEFPFFTFLYADLHAHMLDLPFEVLALAWAASYLLGTLRPSREGGGQHPGWPLRSKWRAAAEAAALWFVGGLALGVPRAVNTWDFPTYLALGLVAVLAAHWLRDPRLTRAGLFDLGWRLALLVGLVFALYYPFDQWFAAAYSSVKRNTETFATINAYLYIYGLFLFILVTFLVWETRRWLAETPATVVTHAGEWLPSLLLVLAGVVVGVAVFWYLEIPTALISLPLMAWAGLLLLRSRAAMPPEKRVVLFLMGTGLALTLFVEAFVVGGDRMNTIFKFYMQVWVLFSVAAGAGLAWLWAEADGWLPAWRSGWRTVLGLLVGVAALYTITATSAKVRDRFPPFGVDAGCQLLPGVALPADYVDNRSLPIEDQPHSLDGLDYMKWSAYCEHGYFMPLAYDYEAIRWVQDNIPGSPVIAEAQTFDLYRMSSRYTWNTGLPDVVGWDWHTRQHNAAIPTEFVTQRGHEVTNFFLSPDPAQALQFIRQFDVGYIVVGPMERALYGDSGGLGKFDALAAAGQLEVVHQNPGVTIYEVRTQAAGQ